MLFNSYTFIFGFLPITLIVFFSLAKFRFITAATAWLVIASLAFYTYWNVAYLPLLLISIFVNYQIGRRIERTKPRTAPAKILLGAGISFNLVLLGYYKYANFFVTSLSQFIHTDWAIPTIILPLGISFYTFTQTAYLVDAYRGETKNYNWLTYSLFVTFFPHLIAGPILHHKDMLPQFQRRRHFVFSYKNLVLGSTLFVLGLSKKVLIADNLLPWVAPVFDHANTVTFLEAWIGALSYTFQLYFDFSGYSDMAIALGWMLNIRLPSNFNSPYKATSIIDFWRRWHITLSNFLRDYLYIPLGGNRKGEIRRYANLLSTMLLGGLWHGAGWTFLLWGGLQGLFLIVNHLWHRVGISLPKVLGWAIAFVSIVFSWVLFRAHTWQDAWEIWQTMAGLKNFTLPTAYQGFLRWLSPLGVQFKPWRELPYLPSLGGEKSLIVLAIMLLCVTQLPNTQEIMLRFKPTWWWAVPLGTMAAFCFISLNQVSEFLYFQF